MNTFFRNVTILGLGMLSIIFLPALGWAGSTYSTDLLCGVY